ncbi:FAD-binding domain-containing protein [Hypomontagnella monticulosa]|nr:FAD-binding domain-containing protein [Hypomontagnella monticulosa]
MVRLVSLLPFLALYGTKASCRSAQPYDTLPKCKSTPLDPSWPSAAQWANLNASIGGALIATKPVASSCYDGNPFNSAKPCSEVTDNWGYSAFHSTVPESVDYPIWANNSCLPPGADGYNESLGCHIGGSPQYVANVTTAEQIATALKWASDANIRVVVKGTGHDLNGRSSGAYSLSIWTHNLKHLSMDDSWPIPGQNQTAHVLIAGSGNTWGDALGFTLEHSRAVVSGVDKTVGLGGFIQGGGHGPLSSTYGLSADQLLQATVVTTSGEILVANDRDHKDLFWAIRGGGGGQYGVVNEYVMLTYPSPVDIATTSIRLSAANMSDYSDFTVNATWNAFARLMSTIPDLMDQGIVGSGGSFTGGSAQRILGLPTPPPGVVASFSAWAYNSTVDEMNRLLQPVRDNILNSLGNDASLITFSIDEPSLTPNYTALFDAMNSSPSTAASISLSSSRLLGRPELSDRDPAEIAYYLRKIMASQVEGSGSFLTIGLQGGLGPRNVPVERRGALNPIWREVYLHVLATGADVDLDSQTPGQALQEAAEWVEVNKEAVWREWAPETGAYMNEANPFNGQWQDDFYGSSYHKLVQIKRTYDPTHTLFVLSGVDSEFWKYNMNTGFLCMTE